ncbi:UvrD-helicase domain-containing protein [Planococcus sp. SE5232]|uniref:UvrD-helicase domain-containing protein n=1 Tax=unclassified Planococcus (in: firmicutes) TaxID=2662419 RepID=UPI003D6ABDFD
MQYNNEVVIAAAGSGKTSELITKANKILNKRILITTFTIENSEEIKRKFFEDSGYAPSNVKIQTWFSFLLNEGVRPYQNFLYDKNRIENIEFVTGRSTNYVRKNQIEKYYFRAGKYIYTDKMCDFIMEVNKLSHHAIIKRLESLYDVIMIDEVQDLAGHDLDFLFELFKSKIEVVVVGDNRQAVFFTNQAAKNKNKKGEHIFNLFKAWEDKGFCKISYKTNCYRSNQEICDLADLFYPEMPKTKSLNQEITGHDGLFHITSQDVESYISKYNPQILRYDRKTKFKGESLPLNFRKSKGLTFNRVLILCNGPLNKFLKTGELEPHLKSKAPYYVALTRARYSVCFVSDEKKIKNEYIESYALD